MVHRCAWPATDLEIEYHDTVWGVPCHDDKQLFEFLILEGAQAGLSWSTILKKRDGYTKAFANWNVKKIAKFTDDDVGRLMQFDGIVRNRLKIKSAIRNANAFIAIQKEFGSFDAYIWAFVNGKPIVNRRKSMQEIPASTELSDTISKDLKKKGFNFVGSTIVYAYMQAIGIVNDHEVSCFRYNKIKNSY